MRSQKADHQRTQKWRLGLLSLYMYLISAPFLATVTYYLLWWLDLTKKPILVLVSFSIGLISDQIVDKIIDVVKKLRELSPLYEMVKEGIDLTKIEWAAH